MGKVIIIERHFKTDHCYLKMHYSKCLEGSPQFHPATIKFTRKKRNNLSSINIKLECDYETFKFFVDKYLYLDDINITELINDFNLKGE